jgi:hypothetical protein
MGIFAVIIVGAVGYLIYRMSKNHAARNGMAVFEAFLDLVD